MSGVQPLRLPSLILLYPNRIRSLCTLQRRKA
ncbi:Uncharacterised protein [Vibrio cholerae]|nr:Uncharacterised protein [Vibrio cholerae]